MWKSFFVIFGILLSFYKDLKSFYKNKWMGQFWEVQKAAVALKYIRWRENGDGIK